MAIKQLYTARTFAELLQSAEISVSFEKSQICDGEKDTLQRQIQDGKERCQSNALLFDSNEDPVVYQCILALHDDDCKLADLAVM